MRTEHDPILDDLENQVHRLDMDDTRKVELNEEITLVRSASTGVGRRSATPENIILDHSKSVRVNSTSKKSTKRKNTIPPVPPLPKNIDEIQPIPPVPPLPKSIDQLVSKPAEIEPTSPKKFSFEQKDPKPKEDTPRVKTLNTKVFIDDANNHVTLQLNTLLTSGMVIQYLKKKNILDTSHDWTLFEIDNCHHVERPLREWEIVLDVLNAWNVDVSNALLIKKYMFHYTLTPETIFQKSIPMHGWLSIEYKKGKWQKRYCFIKDSAIHHAKDKNAPSSMLCHLASYDMYTLHQPLKISPTPFVFAIRAQNKPTVFEKETDYIRFMATEDPDEMKQWVLSIRQSKSIIQYQHHPQRVAQPFVMAEEEKETLFRRQKSIKTLTPSRSESTQKTRTLGRSPTVKESESRGLSRSPTVKDSEEPRSRALGRSATMRETEEPKTRTLGRSATMRETEEPKTRTLGRSATVKETESRGLSRSQTVKESRTSTEEARPGEEQGTLIHIDDKVKFSKGSLLAQNNPPEKMKRSKSLREAPVEHAPEPRRNFSLRRKPTVKKMGEDMPLPSASNTLLQLDDSPEAFHSKELRGRHVKPLLQFENKI